MKVFFLLLSILFFLQACEESVFTPKPRAYFNIDLPEKKYHWYRPSDCPFQFMYPEYAQIVRDTSFFGKEPDDPCWLNIVMDNLGSVIHISYKPISKNQTLFKLNEDAHKMSFKHSIKADYIEEKKIDTEKGVHGVLYNIGGNAASNLQFTLTDSNQHYLRGALYFSALPNADSLAPVIEFVQKDMLYLIETFEWK